MASTTVAPGCNCNLSELHNELPQHALDSIPVRGRIHYRAPAAVAPCGVEPLSCPPHPPPSASAPPRSGPSRHGLPHLDSCLVQHYVDGRLS
ncbi:unnamed protein product [Urochloa humidicola]